jgi:hypothetical protein
MTEGLMALALASGTILVAWPSVDRLFNVSAGDWVAMEYPVLGSFLGVSRGNSDLVGSTARGTRFPPWPSVTG